MRRLYQFFVEPAMLAREAIPLRERIDYSDRSGTDGTASVYPFWGRRKAGPPIQRTG
jgi:hypothetical protein